MSSNYIFTPSNGVIIPDTADIKAQVQQEVLNAFQDLGEISLEDSTPQGRFIDIETNARSAVITVNAEIANVLINILQSAGPALDAWGANFDIPRNGAEPSSVPVIVTGVINTIIPAGSQAIDDNGIIWLAENEIIIDDEGSASGVFICSQTGAVSLAAGQLNKIVASSTVGIDGWETIINTAAASLGSDIEPDAEYKIRILQSIFNGTALFGNYASACYKIDGVRDVFAYDNPYGEARQLDNINIPAHSVYVCVSGGTDADIAYALYSVKSAGAGWAGNTTVNVIDKTYNTANTVKYQRPDAVNYSIQVNVSDLLNVNSDLTAEIQNVINNYFDNQYLNLGYEKIGIRAVIDPFIIASLLQTQISGISVNSVLIGLKTPAAHAVCNIIKAGITSGITWASVNASAFASAVSSTNGRYNFIYNGEAWLLNNTAVNLADYGLTITGAPIAGDKISVLYASGVLSAAPLPLYADEIPAIAADDITVNINE